MASFDKKLALRPYEELLRIALNIKKVLAQRGVLVEVTNKHEILTQLQIPGKSIIL
jgi:hypothetical protein